MKDAIRIKPEVRAERIDILFDAQTSGGLLISVSKEKVDTLCARLKEKGVAAACIIGEVCKREVVSIIVEP